MPKGPAQDAHSGYVGAGSRLTGRLHAPGPFNVNGDFTGEILSEDVVSVGTAGSFEGKIFARKVVVEGGGRITGEIDAQEVEVRSGGAIIGVSVQAASLTLEPQSNADGARFHIRHDFERSRPAADQHPSRDHAGESFDPGASATDRGD